ncbi:MAG: hypothetical protein H0T73_09780 [Ardenticatenales bacterium]|nr:hypothetical protein [Ardenticatenales bacterium]
MCPARFLVPRPPAALPLLLSGSLAARGASTLAARHQLVFPEEPLPVLPLTEPCALPRAIRVFFQRMNNECFPICDQALTASHLPTLLGWLETLPIGLYGLDSCHEPPESYPEPLALALSLALVEWQDPTEATWWLEEYGHLALPPELSISSLGGVLGEMALGAPLDGLAPLLEMVLQSTGSLFLDMCPGCWLERGGAHAPGWAADDLQALRADWAQAAPRWQLVEVLLDWVAADEPRGMVAIAEALRRAHWRSLFADEYNVRPGGGL